MKYNEFLKRDTLENPYIKNSYTSYLLNVFSDVTNYANFKLKDKEELENFKKIHTEKLETIAKKLEELIWELEN